MQYAPADEKLLCNVSSDEAGAACEKHFHGVCC